MKKLFNVLLYLILGIVGIIVIALISFNLYYFFLNNSAKSVLVEKKELTVDGLTFRDLNNNGKLDIYEDNRQEVEARVEDLLSQMTIEEKVGLMWHPPIGVGDNGEILGKPDPKAFNMVSSYGVLLNKQIRHFNLFQIPETKNLAKWYNNFQKLAEQDRLGIPVTISSDPRHGIKNFIGNDLLGGRFSKWPEPIGLAATNDSSLVAEFGRIAAEELRSVGIKTALHPMADLATEPRWARINGTFGEDADLSAKMTAAYIYGFQGIELGDHTVACMTKHWPGGGPQADGWDAHFRYGSDQDYPGNNFEHHLKPFEAAFEANTMMIMPYYGIAIDQTSENVGMSFNKEIITNLLRNQYSYDGIVCTDWGIVEGFSIFGFTLFESTGWGVDDLSKKQRIKKIIDAGVDQFGGNSNTEELLELVKEGQVTEDRIDESVRRLLRAKFQTGLFDNPYVDVDAAGRTVGKSEFIE
ncbi:MAG: glycoside hydrolase family 3 protein, partial [Cyclobacteriaceae bacterium]|nr:glycoside hydrolase family 3 protein [Cyclobacteriaceae bacterium]